METDVPQEKGGCYGIRSAFFIKGIVSPCDWWYNCSKKSAAKRAAVAFILLNKEGEMTVTGSFEIEDGVLISYSGEDEVVVIPEGVDAIGDDAFRENKTVRRVVIGDEVTYIGSLAFLECENLCEVEIGEGIEYIEGSAFFKCGNLKFNEYDNGYYLGSRKKPYTVFFAAKDKQILSCEIHPDTKILHGHAFFQCERLTEVKIPEGVMQIGQNAFFACRALTEVVIPDSVDEVDEEVFGCCTRLRRIRFSNRTKYIPRNVCIWCKSLTDLEIPEFVTEIGEAAFLGCISLTEVVIPKGVTLIDEDVFWRCESLKSAVILGEATEIRDFVFDHCSELVISGVGGGTADAYAKKNNIAFQKI